MSQAFIDEVIAGLMPPLLAATPDSWCEKAVNQLDVLLCDHAHCEKKAASSALNLIYRYPEHHELMQKMSRLAREELRHFEQVLKLMKTHQITYRHLTPARYAGGLHKVARTHEPAKLIDTLIIGALIEARSCERFARLIPLLPKWLGDYYLRLLKSEARHFEEYLTFAKQFANEAKDDFTSRLALFAEVESELATSSDNEFRFHSGA